MFQIYGCKNLILTKEIVSNQYHLSENLSVS